ncbi:hypothetical protein Glove_505g37 [Diversispora epigaea]|uniref:Uncharacterized protein n=1 Tax=Diversispora epigaea TaxID=1348612 RepID=A0A397GPY5_9GLOM|nr:hypothetical protein Glove_505g37 [Diversispora epigaea]
MAIHCFSPPDIKNCSVEKYRFLVNKTHLSEIERFDIMTIKLNFPRMSDIIVLFQKPDEPTRATVVQIQGFDINWRNTIVSKIIELAPVAKLKVCISEIIFPSAKIVLGIMNTNSQIIGP